MAETTNRGIKNSMSLLAYARTHGKMAVGTFRDKEGKEFKSCTFTSPIDGSVSFVGFSSKMGPLTPAQISAQQHDLQVVELNDDPVTGKAGGSILCRMGENAWEDVNLDL